MNPVLTCIVAKNAGWLKKYAEEQRLEKIALQLGKLFKKVSPHLATGGASVGSAIGYNIYADKKIQEKEKNRELVGAINDMLVRKSIGDIYGASGYQAPEIPLAVSKEVSPEYKRVLEQMGKGASEKETRRFGEIMKKVYPHLATGGASVSSAIGYNILKDRKIQELEKNRELVGAMNDTLVRQHIGNIYNAAGYASPDIPLAVSKEVSPQYKELLERMNKGASEKVAFNPFLLRKLPKLLQRPAVQGVKTVRGVVRNPHVAKGIDWSKEMTKRYPKTTKGLMAGGIATAGFGLGRSSKSDRPQINTYYQ